MQILHRISLASTPEVRRELAALGVVVAERGFVSFEVDETSEIWPALKDWIQKRHAVDSVTTKFLKTDLAEARWLELMPDWHHGYPQPKEDRFGYRAATYDLTDYCERCGIGLRQKAPFQMKSEPKWGRNGILQLNWIFDEFFATPEVWTSVFEPQGIGSLPVTNTKGSELKTVVQLVTDEQVSVVTEGLPAEKCANSGRVKYLPVTRGLFPALTSEPRKAMARTDEYFGSGASAHKRVIISQGLARALASAKVRGASLRPTSEARSPK